MARYLRDPSGDDPLPRSFRHRGLHHGPGSTQNQARPGLEIRRAGLHGCVDPAAGSLPSLTQGHPPPPVPTHPLPPAREPGSCRLTGVGEKAGDTERRGDGGTCLVHEASKDARQFPGVSHCTAACNPWDRSGGQGSILPSFTQHVPGTWHRVGTRTIPGGLPPPST